METVMSRIGRMLGMRMYNTKRPVCPVPKSPETVSSSPDTIAIAKVLKRKTRKHLKSTYMKTNDSIDKVNALRIKRSYIQGYRCRTEHLQATGVPDHRRRQEAG